MNGLYERIMNSVPHVHRSSNWQPMLNLLRLLCTLKLNFHLNLHLKLRHLLKPTPNPLMRSSHWELLFLHWEERGCVKLQRTGRKLECIPHWESILGGVYDPGQEAPYEGAVEGLTITSPAKPLARAAPATSSTTGPTGAAPGAPASASANVRTALGAMGTIRREPDFEVFAFIIRS